MIMDCHHSENWSIKVVPFADPDRSIMLLVRCCMGLWLLASGEQLTTSREGTGGPTTLMKGPFRQEASCRLLGIAYHPDGSSQEEGDVRRCLLGAQRRHQ